MTLVSLICAVPDDPWKPNFNALVARRLERLLNRFAAQQGRRARGFCRVDGICECKGKRGHDVVGATCHTLEGIERLNDSVALRMLEEA